MWNWSSTTWLILRFLDKTISSAWRICVTLIVIALTSDDAQTLGNIQYILTWLLTIVSDRMSVSDESKVVTFFPQESPLASQRSLEVYFSPFLKDSRWIWENHSQRERQNRGQTRQGSCKQKFTVSLINPGRRAYETVSLPRTCWKHSRTSWKGWFQRFLVYGKFLLSCCLFQRQGVCQDWCQ